MTQYACDKCPFTSSDPDAIRGHQYNAPVRGWLGLFEHHTMSPDYSAMSDEQLRERLEDAEGESGSCSDEECGCHRTPSTVREELEYREATK